jgi:hypothetical protein
MKSRLSRYHLSLGLFFLLFCFKASAQVDWYSISVPTEANLLSIDFPTDQVGYMGGDGVLLKTMNGGLTWNHVEILQADFNLTTASTYVTDLHFFDANHGLMVLSEWTGLYRTVDGGSTWEQEVPASSGFCRVKCLLFEDEDHGMLGGGGCFQSGLIDQYTEGLWSVTNTDETFNSSELINGIARKENIVVAVTNDNRILRSVDGGLNFTATSHAFEDFNFTDVALMEDDVFRATYAAENSFGIARSTDLGLTWEIDNELTTFFYPDMYCLHRNAAGKGFIGGIEGNSGTSGLIFSESENFWDFDAVAKPIRDIDSYADSVTWAVGDSGTVYVSVNPVLLGLSNPGTLPSLALFPNPCSNELFIDLNSISQVSTFDVFDARGKRCTVSYTISDSQWKLDTRELNSGQYFLKIYSGESESVQSFFKE